MNLPFNMNAFLNQFMFSCNFLPATAGRIWRGTELAPAQGRVHASGHAILDAQLPGGGWPVGTLIELLLPHSGIGELRLLGSALSQITQADRPVALIGAPHIPYGPALADQQWALDQLLIIDTDDIKERLWACEQTLKSGGVAALVAWLPKARSDQLRRLQLAAQSADVLLFVIRPMAAQSESSPAPLRLLCRATYEEHSNQRLLEIRLLKRRGPALEQPLHLSLRQPVATSQRTRQVSRFPESRTAIDFSAYASPRHALDRSHLTAAAH
jgi:protein ImuA